MVITSPTLFMLLPTDTVNFFEIPTRDLDDDIVQAGFKESEQALATFMTEFSISLRGIPRPSLAAIKASRYPVALEARADKRDINVR